MTELLSNYLNLINMLLQINPTRLEKLFSLFYGMMLAGVTDPVLVSVFEDLTEEAKRYYGDDYHRLCEALNDDFQVLQPN